MIAELAASWRAEAELLRRRGADGHAKLIDSCADELEVHLRRLGNETVNLREAAAMSGYCEDWLGENVRAGKIPNAGKKHAPRIRIIDLPRKAGCASDAGDVTVLRLDATRRRDGLEEAQGGRRIRSQGRRHATVRLPEPVPQVGG